MAHLQPPTYTELEAQKIIIQPNVSPLTKSFLYGGQKHASCAQPSKNWRVFWCFVLLLLILVCLPSSNTPVFLQLLASPKYFNNSAVIAPFRLISSLTAKTRCIYAVFCIVPPARRFQSLVSCFGNEVCRLSLVSSGETWQSQWGCNTHQTQSQLLTLCFWWHFPPFSVHKYYRIHKYNAFFSLKTLFHTHTPSICHLHASFSSFTFWLTYLNEDAFSSVIDLGFSYWC